jgi:hypothetical protein
MSKVMRLVGVVVLVVMPCSTGWSGLVINVGNDQTLYGHLSQLDPSVTPSAIQTYACVPTGTSNSLVYLENVYSGVYGRSLVPDNDPSNGLHDTREIGNTASTLANLSYMNTRANIGTYTDMEIYGAHKYMEEKAPGQTSYAAVMGGTWGYGGAPVPKPDWVQDNMYPPGEYLGQNLLTGHAVEIALSATTWGHSLTLTGFHWNDANNDLFLEPGEATISYIDPWNGSYVSSSSIWQQSDGHGHDPLTVNYNSTDMTVTMAMAMAPSDLPEPGTLELLLATGATMAGWTIWQRKRQS